jgi:hypothetical protein
MVLDVSIPSTCLYCGNGTIQVKTLKEEHVTEELSPKIFKLKKSMISEVRGIPECYCPVCQNYYRIMKVGEFLNNLKYSEEILAHMKREGFGPEDLNHLTKYITQVQERGLSGKKKWSKTSHIWIFFQNKKYYLVTVQRKKMLTREKYFIAIDMIEMR